MAQNLELKAQIAGAPQYAALQNEPPTMDIAPQAQASDVHRQDAMIMNETGKVTMAARKQLAEEAERKGVAYIPFIKDDGQPCPDCMANDHYGRCPGTHRYKVTALDKVSNILGDMAL